MFFLKRYLFGFVITVITSLITFLATIYFFEGVIPTIVGILSLIIIIGFIPYNIKQDYNKVKICIININAVRKGEMTKTDFSIDLAQKVYEETGFPDFIINKAISKFKIK
jgi:hypothetical protein